MTAVTPNERTASAEGMAANAAAEPKPPARSATLRPLVSLLPYARRYRGRVAAALCALVVAALTTLAVPIAVRRMIDFGFSGERLTLIDSYFAVMIVEIGRASCRERV